jgi:hypothetical protein
MKQVLNLVLVFFMMSGVGSAFAQTQDSYEYNSEFTWGINKNSAGGLIGGLCI